MSIIEIISIIANLIFGSGIIGMLIFYRAKHRSAVAEATTSEHSAEGAAIRNMHESLVEWKELAQSREDKLNKRDELIDRLYVEKNEDRKAVNKSIGENMKLKLDLQTARFRMCARRGCPQREPQTGY